MIFQRKTSTATFGPIGGMVLAALLVAGSAHAGPIDILVGDKDGFGFGCSDTGICANFTTPPIDNRSAGESAAVNGAQFTDIYSSLFPGSGPNGTSTGDVLIPFSGTLLSGTLTVAAADFQSSSFGAFLANINGSSESFAFNDGYQVASIKTFTLTAPELAAANVAGQVDLHMDRNGSGDYVSFDWFELTGTTTSSVPEPGYSIPLFIALVGLALTRRAWNRSEELTGEQVRL